MKIISTITLDKLCDRTQQSLIGYMFDVYINYLIMVYLNERSKFFLAEIEFFHFCCIINRYMLVLGKTEKIT